MGLRCQLLSNEAGYSTLVAAHCNCVCLFEARMWCLQMGPLLMEKCLVAADCSFVETANKVGRQQKQVKNNSEPTATQDSSRANFSHNACSEKGIPGLKRSCCAPLTWPTQCLAVSLPAAATSSALSDWKTCFHGTPEPSCTALQPLLQATAALTAPLVHSSADMPSQTPVYIAANQLRQAQQDSPRIALS